MTQPLLKHSECFDFPNVNKMPRKNARSKPEGISKHYLSFDEVFGELEKMEFSKKQAIEYLEISKREFKQFLCSGSLTSKLGIDGETAFPANELSEFKKQLRNERI